MFGADSGPNVYGRNDENETHASPTNAGYLNQHQYNNKRKQQEDYKTMLDRQNE